MIDPKLDLEHDLTPEQRAELGDLSPLFDRLAAHDLPAPDSAKLMAVLRAESVGTPNGASDTANTLHTSGQTRRGVRHWLRLAWAQTALVEPPFWTSTLLLTGIGLLWGLGNGSGWTTLCLLFLSPLLAVGGVAYFFRPATRTLWELELLSQTSPFQLLMARMAVILSLNFGLALLLFGVAWTQGLQIIFWRLLLLWFGPMIGIMGLALFCSVRWNTPTGVIVPMLAWGALILIGWRETIFKLEIGLIPAAESGALVAGLVDSNLLMALAGAALAAGIALILESGRLVERWR